MRGQERKKVMKQRGIKRIVFFLLFVLTLLTFGGSPFSGGAAYAKTFRLTIGSGHPPVVPWIERMRDFFSVEVKKRVKQKTGDEIEWVEAFGGTVAKLGGELDAVQGGSIDICSLIFPFESSKLFVHNFSYFLPFSSSDVRLVTEASLKVYAKVPYLKNVFEEKYNQKLLGIGGSGSYGLITTFPWKQVEQLKGIKIGAAGPNMAFAKGVGAVPVQMSVGDVYNNLKTGIGKGAFLPVDIISSLKLYEICKYLTESGTGATCLIGLSMNLDKWKSLPAKIQEILMEVGSEYAWDLAKYTEAREKSVLESLQKQGVTIYRLPFAEREKWANMMPNIPGDAVKQAKERGMPVLAEVMKIYIAELEKGGYKFPRHWVIE